MKHIKLFEAFNSKDKDGLHYLGHYNYLEGHENEINNETLRSVVVFHGTKTIKDKNGEDYEVMVKKMEIDPKNIIIEPFDRGLNFYSKTDIGDYDEISIHINRKTKDKMFNRDFDVAYLTDEPRPDNSKVDLQALINKVQQKMKDDRSRRNEGKIRSNEKE